MIKFIFLSLITISCSFSAMADVVAFVFGDTTTIGNIPEDKTIIVPDGSVADTLFSVDDVLTLQFEGANGSWVTNKKLRWNADDKLQITPVQGVIIDKISIKVGGASYIDNLTTSWGQITPTKEDSISLPEVWTPGEGPQPASITITPTKEKRIEYIQVEYSDGNPVVETVATPVFSEPAGPVAGGTQVLITCQTEGATIYYTTDGSIPSATNGSEYVDGITITDSVTIKAIAIKADYLDSEVATAEYTIKKPMETVATPAFSEPAGPVAGGTQVLITCQTEGASIYYTTDGSIPSATNGSEYVDGITITDSVTIKAIAIKADYLDSEVATAEYTIRKPMFRTATFVFSSDSEGYNLQPEVEIPSQSNRYVYLDDVSFVNGGITVTFDKGTNPNDTGRPTFFYPTTTSNKGKIELRVYKDNTITFSCSDGYMTSITFTQWDVSTEWNGFTASNGATIATTSYICPADLTSLVLTSRGTSRFKSVTVGYLDNGNGSAEIDDVVVEDHSQDPVEFYNLQGYRVNAQALTPGFYVCRQGANVKKVFVR